MGNLRRARWLANRSQPRVLAAEVGADDRARTGDLVLTKDVLCQLSYIGVTTLPDDYARSSFRTTRDLLERETGIEPATNSLEGCDSTIELLPLEGIARNIFILRNVDRRGQCC